MLVLPEAEQKLCSMDRSSCESNVTPWPYLIQINLVLMGDWAVHSPGISNSETTTQDCLSRSLLWPHHFCLKHSASSPFCIASNIIYSSSFPRASTESYGPIHYLLFPFQLNPPLYCPLVEIPIKTFFVLYFMLLLRHGGDYKHPTELSCPSSAYKQTLTYSAHWVRPGSIHFGLWHSNSLSTGPCVLSLHVQQNRNLMKFNLFD